MKKANIILTSIATLSIVGGTLAFKIDKCPVRNVYSLLPGNKIHTQLIGGIVFATTVPNCTYSAFRVDPSGVVRNDLSTLTTNALSITVFKSAGHTDVTTTWPYCTAAQLTVCVVSDEK